MSRNRLRKLHTHLREVFGGYYTFYVLFICLSIIGIAILTVGAVKNINVDPSDIDASKAAINMMRLGFVVFVAGMVCGLSIVVKGVIDTFKH